MIAVSRFTKEDARAEFENRGIETVSCNLCEPEQLEELEDTAKALFTAAGIGVLIGKNASFSGARGGCQAEVGSASCMAAAAVVEAKGGTPQQAANAAAFALMNTLGLVCDPIADLWRFPA